ncbi:hypothetical protein ACLOJK_017812 [Asimina triloba]
MEEAREWASLERDGRLVGRIAVDEIDDCCGEEEGEMEGGDGISLVNTRKVEACSEKSLHQKPFVPIFFSLSSSSGKKRRRESESCCDLEFEGYKKYGRRLAARVAGAQRSLYVKRYTSKVEPALYLIGPQTDERVEAGRFGEQKDKGALVRTGV